MARDTQTQINDDDTTRDVLPVTPKQFRGLLVMRSTAGVPAQPDVQAEIMRRQEALRQQAHDERR